MEKGIVKASGGALLLLAPRPIRRPVGSLGSNGRRTATLFILAALIQLGCSSTFDDLALAKETSSSCTHAGPPGPPTVATDQTRALDFVAAVNEYDMGEIDHGAATERYRTMSFDLDRTCTGQGEGPSCTNSFWMLDNPIAEGPEGRDNAQGAIIHRVHEIQGSTSATGGVNSGIATGSATTIIRVRGYNGTTLDSKVEVAVFGATLNGAGAFTKVPVWDGSDEWAAGAPWWVDLDEENRPSTEHPKYFDADAYVTDDILVAHLERYDVPTLIRMSQVVITARITPDEGGGWALKEGIFAGRANIDDLLASLEFIRDPDTRDWICMNADNYQARKQSTCAAADISFEESDDPSAPCDASSWGWAFSARPAKLSGVATATLNPTCDEGQSPALDSCAIH